MSIIYRPKGRAAETSHLAANYYVGCLHGCKYCYVPAFTHNESFHSEQWVRKDVLWQLRREAPNFKGTDERVLLCFTCDPYQPLDDTEQVTREAIKILKANEIPFQILTKGGMAACRDFDLYGPHDAFATTLTLLDSDKSALWEPRAANPATRIYTIQLAKERGIETWVSLEPVIDPKVSLQIIEQTHEIVDLYKIGIMNHRDTVGINWRKFGRQAIELCRKHKANYFIKSDLVKYLDGISFYNVDNRKVTKSDG